jgi:superfamily I DNA/RNA helicase
MAFTPSIQQAVFLDWISNGTGSCVLEAVAGAGKTTTLIEAIERTGGGVAFLAYNKKIADEIKGKLGQRGIDWKTADAGTIHSFGFRAYRKAFPDVKVDGNKLSDLAAVLLNNDKHPLIAPLVKLVSLAKQRALGVLGSIDDKSLWFDIISHFDVLASEDLDDDATERFVDAGIALLRSSNSVTDIVDFDDMVYLPLVKKVRFWRNKWVFVDEAQDTNPARRALVRALLAPGGRVVAVGDRHQAIYGFTGADSDSLDLIAQDFDCCRLPLTTTYRCPQAIVAFAQQWVSHIEAHESAPLGSVTSLPLSALLGRNDLNGDSAILCRNTKPLVELAFKLIRAKVACKVEGRDIGLGLIKLATKWKNAVTLHGLEVKLADWSNREITKALAKKNETRAQSVEDQVATLQVIIDQCRAERRDSVAAVVDAINEIFANDVSGILVLSTIHKSKGREWNTVFWLDRAGTCPSKYARQAWQQEQEINLQYVAATRAKRSLVDLYAAPEGGQEFARENEEAGI